MKLHILVNNYTMKQFKIYKTKIKIFIDKSFTRFNFKNKLINEVLKSNM